MPRTRECDFCGADIEPGTGTMLVLNDGTTHHFCSSKCEKNIDLGREPRDVEWTEAGQRQGGPRQPEPEPVAESEAIDADGTDDGGVESTPETTAEGDADIDEGDADGEAAELDAGDESEADADSAPDEEIDEEDDEE